MAVVVEPLGEAKARIAATGSEVLGVTRLPRVGALPTRQPR